jgi:predicted ATPase/tRNA A-37 threonylcarbamoyl transferase component Bud32
MNAILPGYRVSQQIYESANSVVYRATREHDNRPVILKVLKPDYPNLAELAHYNQEYEILRQLNVTGVVETYGLEPYRNTLVLILEDFGGVSIRPWLERKARAGSAAVPLAQCLEIVSKIAAGLDQIHTSGVFHKNVNPSNVVFNPDTGELKLIDFGLATTLHRETPTLKIPQVLEGTLAYLSPEQTGRMNRTVDYRTDFYSLGVMFYELLTGCLPFEATDTLELVHAHLAKSPVAPHELDPTIPEVVSNLVLKLMEKAPEDRYQSAQGIRYDLDLCWRQVQSGQIPGFALGERDWTDHFLIPEKLYGRDAEIEKLISAFERAAHGSTEMMLVTGFSGVGKTAVINEIHTPIVRQRGYFIKGKFDQLSRNIPFSAFVQAFRDLMGQLLSESKAQRYQWRSTILSALGESAQVISEVIPELERIIGPQPPVPELTGSAAQNRFNLLFQKFIATFATSEHPLVIFLDDLQWADLASLKLVQLLVSQTSRGYLLLLGAYRDNEVSPAHPLMLTLDEINKTGATLTTIRLAPLGQPDINQLIADTLGCSPELTLPLTKLVYQKTQGNPFFNNQFLKTLYEEKLVTFDFEVGYWQFDIAQVSTLALTEDVVEFMTLRLQKLPAATQEVLKSAACIGNQFDLETLAIVHQKSETEAAADLWQAVRAGAVLPQDEVYEFVHKTHGEDSTFSADARDQFPTYRFLHDRVQQAAYSLIPEAERPTLHLNIGRLLLSKTQEQQLEERLFEIISQFNAGLSQITDPAERETLAHLNLQAGQKAKAATAYTAAMNYLTVGLSLLPPDCWQTHYPLTLSMYQELVEVAYLVGNFEQMDQWAMLVLQQATTLLDKVKVYEVQIQAEIARNQLKAALDLGLSVLAELDIVLPDQPDQAEIESAFQRVPVALAGKPVSELLHLPLMTDPVHSRLLG